MLRMKLTMEIEIKILTYRSITYDEHLYKSVYYNFCAIIHLNYLENVKRKSQ